MANPMTPSRRLSLSQSFARVRPVARQRGVVLVITLVAMVILLVGLAALLRDLTNRAEQAIVTAKAQLTAKTLTTADNTSLHYSAVKLANGSTGVPAILDSSNYNTTYGADTADTGGDTSITLRYVIDRQCNALPTATTTFVTSACEYITTSGDSGGSSQDKKTTGSTRPIYRISVRVSGPRNSVAYFQTTYAN